MCWVMSMAGPASRRVELYSRIVVPVENGAPVEEAAASTIDWWQSERGEFLPGFGHRFHPVDPACRAPAGGDRRSGGGRGRGGPLRHRRPRRRGGPGTTQGQAGADEHRRRHRGDLWRVGVSGAAGPRAVLPVPFASASWRTPSSSLSVGERNKGPIPRSFLWAYEGPAARPIPNTDTAGRLP